MFSSSQKITVPIALALALLAGPALAGCSVQNLANSATGGKVELPGKSVPKDFPSEVPLVQGDVLLGGGVGDGKGGKAWNVTIKVPGASSFDSIAKQLEGAGFAPQGSLAGTGSEGGTGVFEGTTYGVILVVSEANKQWTANYTVTTKDKK
jgi:hypothetical protein